MVVDFGNCQRLSLNKNISKLKYLKLTNYQANYLYIL